MTAPNATQSLRMPPFVLLAISLLAGMGIFVVMVGAGTVLAYVATNSTDPLHPTGMLLAALMFVHALAAVLAGVAAGKMTRAHSLYTVLLLSLMLATSSMVQLVRGTANAGEPTWYLVARCLLVFSGILVGGALQRWRGRSPDAA